ncbi:hypothetical protein IPM09_04500 [Candidatus Saccharibacteria bacterium]|nr:MAG: hypothetical protein IPM09_04500 [Candidatus Saccharibacteria bacterium]
MSAQQERPPTFVLLESPFAADTEEGLRANHDYAMAAMRDALMRHHEAPFASHLLYTQMLDDTVPIERHIGIEAGLAIGMFAERTVVYMDRGISRGMRYGIDNAKKAGRPIVYRSLNDFPTSFEE